MENAQKIIEKNNTIAMSDTSIVVPENLPDDISQGVTKEGEIRRIVVDRTACIGARPCVVVAEKLFQVDDENLAYVLDPDSADQETIRLAAESCPVLAILLYDKDGNQIFPQ
tara:strand:+ start:1144 stop:1479 length:336 start_codon:yes stop_codon:yes gene_type:complete